MRDRDPTLLEKLALTDYTKLQYREEDTKKQPYMDWKKRYMILVHYVTMYEGKLPANTYDNKVRPDLIVYTFLEISNFHVWENTDYYSTALYSILIVLLIVIVLIRMDASFLYPDLIGRWGWLCLRSLVAESTEFLLESRPDRSEQEGPQTNDGTTQTRLGKDPRVDVVSFVTAPT